MNERFRNKSALVVGASRGIGFAAARNIAAEGGSVAITGRDEETLSEAARLIKEETGTAVLPVVGHARRAEERRVTVETAATEFGKLDVLVYTTATNISRNASVLELDPEVLRKEYDLNVVSALEYTKLAYWTSMRDNGGSVVLLSSIAAFGNVRLAGYSMTKSALEILRQHLADQLAPAVRVNSVAPGFVDTAFAEKLKRLPKEQVDASYPLGREGTPEDVARAITFLASDEAEWITGTALAVDGGKGTQPYRHDLPHVEVGSVLH
ncbi:NAD(P)-dependent dehydrogenase, short-chain alcohol dehydrogenase family [Actinopolyspora lacussalsi subsp. righensis]|uniref:NAD(P)-dependent dehydrogenase, short-chain alcohol dehydrogenase family n=1 Tax=Actinopolyspora righensis TaxID=995060 RepID=A0A1I7AMC2_9ACTN|nr:glucose 1-dehydrogenase [Actinopolyspora righensis]SFT76088.1 NAD(P)-dependent dehydrogenase, short-chain alcohol dehydrogenase family [Actinopolyspora righensis]